MAVPKSKRSKQAVSIYRNNKIVRNLNKHNISLKNKWSYLHYLNPENAIDGDKNCVYCCDTSFKSICLNCYTKHFKGAYIKYIKNKK